MLHPEMSAIPISGFSIQIVAWGGHHPPPPPPHRGEPKAGDKGSMGVDWRVIHDKIKGTKKLVLT